MEPLSDEEFDEAVVDALDLVPDELARAMDNVVVLVEDVIVQIDIVVFQILFAEVLEIGLVEVFGFFFLEGLVVEIIGHGASLGGRGRA